jgi:ribosomal protein L7/L12
VLTNLLSIHSPLSKQNNTLQTYVKKAIKMEEAEELKTKLEAAGATVEIV